MIHFEGQAFYLLVCQIFVVDIVLLTHTSPGTLKLQDAENSCDWHSQAHGQAVLSGALDLLLRLK